MKGWPSLVFWLAPITLVILVLVGLYMHLTDTKVERATTASALHEETFNQDFDKRWAEMGGDPATCISAGNRRIADLRKQLAALNKEVAQERQGLNQKTSELNSLLEEMEGKKNEKQ